LDHHDYTRAARELTRGLASIEGLPGNSRLSEELSAALKVSDRLENADRLHQLADRVRFAEAAADASIPPPKGVEEHCRAVWQSRSSLLENNGEPLDPELERRIRDDLLDMALIGSDLRVRWASDPVKAAHARRAALAILGEAEAEFGSSHLLCRAKQAHASALGLVRESAASGLAASRALPRTAWEHDAVGRLLLAAGELAEAATEFEKALALSPDELWPNFHQGVCAFRRGRYDEAVDAFRVCVALAPKRAECFYNRALAYAAMGHTASASRDFGRAVSLDPSLASFPPTVDGRPVPALRSP
jgi:tetratricopeptide (TPR) repeat protein